MNPEINNIHAVFYLSLFILNIISHKTPGYWPIHSTLIAKGFVKLFNLAGCSMLHAVRTRFLGCYTG